MLTGASPSNAGTTTTAAAVPIAAAVVATWLPARRALSVDPVEALRAE